VPSPAGNDYKERAAYIHASIRLDRPFRAREKYLPLGINNLVYAETRFGVYVCASGNGKSQRASFLTEVRDAFTAFEYVWGALFLGSNLVLFSRQCSRQGSPIGWKTAVWLRGEAAYLRRRAYNDSMGRCRHLRERSNERQRLGHSVVQNLLWR